MCSFIKLLDWHIKENGMGVAYDQSKKLIKNHRKSYIYVKNYEENYGDQVKSLCRKVETVMMNIY